jgi:hypothetical protein
MKHVQVVEKIRSHDTVVKLTLIKVLPITREVPIFCEDNETNRIKKCSDQECKTNNYSDNLFSKHKSANEKKLWDLLLSNKDQNNSSAQISRSLRIKQCLQKLSNHSQSTAKLFNDLSSNEVENFQVANAATKLCNLANQQQNNTFETLKFSKKFKSASNIYYSSSPKINFNDEDDEIYGLRGKLPKSPSSSALAHTITIGRRLKDNVMKLSIFNLFSASNKDLTSIQNSKSIETLDASGESVLNDISKPNVMLNISTNTSKSTKVKMLKKQKKIKKLEKLCLKHQLEKEKSDLSNPESDIMYKTI